MKVQDLFVKDFRTKAMALAIAVGVWFYAYNATMATTETPAPLRISTDPGWVVALVRNAAGKVLADAGDVVTAKLWIEYPQRTRDLLREALAEGKVGGEIKVSAQAKGVETVETEARVVPGLFHVPSGVEARVKVVDPKVLRITLAQVQTRQGVLVEPVFSEAPPGTRIADRSFFPRRVNVTGPKSVVAKLEKIRTEPINISDEPTQYVLPIRRTVGIDTRVKVGGQERLVRCDQRVTCTVMLGPKPAIRTFEDVPILFLMKPDHPYKGKLTLPKSPTLTVRVMGPPERIKELKRESILLFVDVRGLDLAPGGRTYRDVHWRILGVQPGEEVYVEDPTDQVVVARPKGEASK